MRSIVDFYISYFGDLSRLFACFSFSSSIKYLFEPLGCKILAHHIFQQRFYENDGCVLKGTINTFENKVPLHAFSSFTIFYAFQILVQTILRAWNEYT